MTFQFEKPSYFLEDPRLLLKFSNEKLDIQVKMTNPYTNLSQQVQDSQKWKISKCHSERQFMDFWFYNFLQHLDGVRCIKWQRYVNICRLHIKKCQYKWIPKWTNVQSSMNLFLVYITCWYLLHITYDLLTFTFMQIQTCYIIKITCWCIEDMFS